MQRTESLLGLDEGHGELASNRDLLEHASNLKVAAASEVSAVDGLDVVTDTAVLDLGLVLHLLSDVCQTKPNQTHHDAVFADLLDKGVTGTVIGDGKAECGTVLVDLNGLGVTLDVRKEEVIETDLSSEKAGHVDLVCVEGAVENVSGGDAECLGNRLVELLNIGEVADLAGR